MNRPLVLLSRLTLLLSDNYGGSWRMPVGGNDLQARRLPHTGVGGSLPNRRRGDVTSIKFCDLMGASGNNRGDGSTG